MRKGKFYLSPSYFIIAMPIFIGKTSTQALSVSMYHASLELCGGYFCSSLSALELILMLCRGSHDVEICSGLASTGLGTNCVVHS